MQAQCSDKNPTDSNTNNTVERTSTDQDKANVSQTTATETNKGVASETDRMFAEMNQLDGAKRSANVVKDTEVDDLFEEMQKESLSTTSKKTAMTPAILKEETKQEEQSAVSTPPATSSATATPAVKRKRGRPRKDETVIPAERVPPTKRAVKQLNKVKDESANDTLKRPVLVTYDDVHENFRSAITEGSMEGILESVKPGDPPRLPARLKPKEGE